MDRGAWWAAVPGLAESARTDHAGTATRLRLSVWMAVPSGPAPPASPVLGPGPHSRPLPPTLALQNRGHLWPSLAPPELKVA